METYIEMKNRHQAEINALPLAFAFSAEQLKEVLSAWNISEEEAIAGAITPIGHGGYIRTTDKELVNSTFKRIQEERQAAIEADHDGTGYIFQGLKYELINHEYSYTGDIDDTLDALHISNKDLAENPALLNGLNLALKAIGTGADPFDE